MTEARKQHFHYLVFIPHRDAAIQLRTRLDGLFKSGVVGAKLFPGFLFLACLHRSLHRNELTEVARRLRDATLTGGRAGRIRILDCEADFATPELPPGVAIHTYTRPFIPCAWPVAPDAPKPDLPELSFRPGALANLTLTTLKAGSGILNRWEADAIVWLPSLKKGIPLGRVGQ